VLERQAELEALEGLLARAAAGAGGVALVSGEAGIGKTTLVRAFAVRAAEGARVLTGACDDLLAPRPLGALRDMALGIDGPLRRALAAGGDRDAVLTAVLEEVASPLEPTVVVVEDVHWADEATHDVLRVLGRRAAGLPTLLVVTFRDDPDPADPLRRTLAALAGDHVVRLPLRPLSAAALAEMAAGHGIAPERLAALTGGNPFLASEVLAAPDDHVPATVRDATAGRLALLPASAREVVALLASAPGGLDVAVLDAVDPDGSRLLVEAERLALVELVDGRARFRHELLRRAVEATRTAGQRRAAHGRLLAVLDARGAEPSVRVHHALGAGDVGAIIASAPEAAALASRVGSHHDAVALYGEALAHADRMDPAVVAPVRRRYAQELYFSNRHAEAAAQAAQAVALLEPAGPSVQLGAALSMLSHASCWDAVPDVADEAGRRAVSVLRSLPPGPALVAAYANLAFVATMEGRLDEAAEAARLGVDVAVAVGDQRLRPWALAQLGAAAALDGDEQGLDLLHEALELADRHGVHRFVPLCATWLATALLRLGRPGEVGPHVEHGIAYSAQHEISVGVTTLQMLRAELHLREGRWAEAAAGLEAIVADPAASGWGQTAALSLLARLRDRTGGDGADLLERSWALAVRSRQTERLARAGAAWLERAALHGDEGARVRGEQALALVRPSRHRWHVGELLRLRAAARAVLGGGRDDDATDPGAAVGPWAPGIAGDWRTAAAAWGRLGWPFEQARELAASGELAPMLEALRTYDALGASAPAAAVRQELRRRGVRHVPRGPQPTTRGNPAGLTERQVEVLDLVARGLTNAEIAARLVVSVRTVDHHVSAILAKLGVTTRREAAAAARHADDGASITPT
jgi:DNA-binding CsgD family transcriptional regulator/tetratricopeptide (TPR) repeat protein